ncbi:hypothetical protein A6P39_041555 [Streptomyces sp. FXJ1.172]|nr:hypothetical protein [Streptomyces sp. FXJ1.172]WEO99991.1 hypothetical protein A6P39_041555 [Streptomyces sp. FXJ1.172]
MSIVIDQQTIASALLVDRSKARRGRRLCIRWAKNRSTIQRLGSTTKPHVVAALDDRQHRGEGGEAMLDEAAGVAAVGPDQGRKVVRGGDWARRTWTAARSPTSAAVTVTVSNRPRVSTTTCRMRPLISLPPSKPRLPDPTTASALTDWGSITPALGSESRPARSRTLRRSRSRNSRITPWSRQRRKNAWTRSHGGLVLGGALFAAAAAMGLRLRRAVAADAGATTPWRSLPGSMTTAWRWRPPDAAARQRDWALVSRRAEVLLPPGRTRPETHRVLHPRPDTVPFQSERN